MNFTFGSIGAYTRALKMQFKWQQKQDSGNYTQKTEGISQNTEGTSKNTEADFLKQQLDRIREGRDMDMEAIRAKLNSGKKLSSEEMEYLKEKDPGAYQKAKEVEAERKRMKEELKNCKTKEDFQRLKTVKLSVSMAAVNSIANNAAIPKGAKMGLIMQENAKVMAMNDEAMEFVRSGKYDKMPTEEERKEAIHEKLEAGRLEDEDVEETPEDEEPVPEEDVSQKTEGTGEDGGPQRIEGDREDGKVKEAGLPLRSRWKVMG